MTPPSDGCECPACASKGRHYASASWGYFPYFLESLESSDVHVEELFIAYYPDGSRAGEFASEVEALRFLYREACARLDLIALKLEHPLVKNMARFAVGCCCSMRSRVHKRAACRHE